MTGDVALALACAILGLAVGSFLNVVVWRVPRGESVVRPPSACPVCGHGIRPRDNVPVLSWLLLRGRCRDCRAPISMRYPLVEAGTALGFGLVGWWLGATWALPAFLYLVVLTVALGLIDLDVRRLPDVIVLPSYGVVGALLGLAAWNPGGESDWSALVRAAVGGLALLAFYFLLVVVYPSGMGLGDVKLAGLLGAYLAWCGWGALVVGAFAAFLVGGAFAIGLLLAGRGGRKSKIPFGPWMFVGCWIGVLVGQQAWDAYLGVL